MIRHLLLGVIALAVAAVLATSSRPWALTNRPQIDRVADIPARSQAKLRHFLDASGMILPHNPDLARSDDGPPRLRLGYSFRELDVMRMPFAAYPDLGIVLYEDRPDTLQMVPLDGATLGLLRGEAGRRLGAGYSFAFWRYLWGWSFVAAFLLWYVLQRRAEQLRRDALGLI